MSRNAVDYERDFFAWTVEQAELLRAGKLAQLDAANVAEEIESLGRRDRRELLDRLEKLIMELLKWRLDRGARCGYWESSMVQQRFEIDQIIDDSPSLREFAAGRLANLYSDARDRLVEELRLLRPDFPPECPFSLDQVLAEDFLPED